MARIAPAPLGLHGHHLDADEGAIALVGVRIVHILAGLAHPDDHAAEDAPAGAEAHPCLARLAQPGAGYLIRMRRQAGGERNGHRCRCDELAPCDHFGPPHWRDRYRPLSSGRLAVPASLSVLPYRCMLSWRRATPRCPDAPGTARRQRSLAKEVKLY